jgi:hypothetical protein
MPWRLVKYDQLLEIRKRMYPTMINKTINMAHGRVDGYVCQSNQIVAQVFVCC